ncbi:polysaccharide pyruvyl transferase family protein [Weissella halotolerans]|uniref:Polysaccharide biosynthesis protein n=1 Tax=Weissella halotolerans DSM 20190 TaxID=1123500 RepID=A0A0R2FS96_9LACO|nr:polysaccharide pyruvyl transferase family protein [Weissella halotolerans]KRN31281.1 polysaccharide biosynthesis protein [Weissella halotolerans DSM 20190]
MRIKKWIRNIVGEEKWLDLIWWKRYFFSLFRTSPLDKKLKKKPKILLLGVADYANLGDQAIGYAQRRFLDKLVSGRCNVPIIEVGSSVPIRFVYQIISRDDIIVFTGGGNLGNKYTLLHDIFLPVIKKFPKNEKIFFPQSYTFTDGKNNLNYIKKVFSKSGDKLTIVARETKSLGLFQDIFPQNNILLTPDIVLSLDERRKNNSRDGILMMMRDESEKILNPNVQNQLKDYLKNIGYNVTLQQDYSEYATQVNIRYGELTKQWDKIRSSKLVITDRLHGMIFSQITGTPCLVFDNYNSKIKLTYKNWLAKSENIVFVDPRLNPDVDWLVEKAQQLIDSHDSHTNLANEYMPLVNKLQFLVTKLTGR